MQIVVCGASKFSPRNVLQVLLNRYREQKVLYENVGAFIDVIKEAVEIAKAAMELVDNKTAIQNEIKELLSLSGNLGELYILKVDTQLRTISPPCLPFQLHFTLKTKQPTSHNAIYPICFNGEFYKNLGHRIMRIRYPEIDDMNKALEDAELRYARIRGIRNRLSRVEKDVRKGSTRGNISKRGSIPFSPAEDPV